MKTSAARDWGLRLLVFSAVVGLWELFRSYSQNFLLPRFSEIVGALFRLLFFEDRFWEALYVSNQALLLGYAIAVVVGIPLGLAAGGFRWMDRIVNRYVGVLLAMPIAPFIPIVIIALGLGLSARVFIVVLFAFIFITVNAGRSPQRGAFAYRDGQIFWGERKSDMAQDCDSRCHAGHFRRYENRSRSLRHWNGYGGAPLGSERAWALAIGIFRSNAV